MKKKRKGKSHDMKTNGGRHDIRKKEKGKRFYMRKRKPGTGGYEESKKR